MSYLNELKNSTKPTERWNSKFLDVSPLCCTPEPNILNFKKKGAMSLCKCHLLKKKFSCLGRPHFTYAFTRIWAFGHSQVLKAMNKTDINIIILSLCVDMCSFEIPSRIVAS